MNLIPHLTRLKRRSVRAGRLGAKWVRQRVAPCPSAERETVLVTGMQRSGTNMVMDILERSPETDVYHERDSRAFENFQMRELRVIQELHQRSAARFFVIKALCEADQISELLEIFEPAVAVWIFRQVDDVALSAVRSFSNFPAQIERLVRGGEPWDWRARGLSLDTRERLSQLYHPGLREIDAAALLWYARNILFFEQGLDFDPRVELVSYEGLVGSPVQNFREVFGFLGLGFYPQFVSEVHADAVSKRDHAVLEPGVRQLCEELEGRLRETKSLGARKEA